MKFVRPPSAEKAHLVTSVANIPVDSSLAIQPKRHWGLSALLVVGLHGAALAGALWYTPAPILPPAEVEAIMIDLAPLPPPPEPPKPEPKPPEPEVKPEPPKPEPPKPVAKPKPKPKPKPVPVKQPEVVDPTPQAEPEPPQEAAQPTAPAPAAQPQQPRHHAGMPSWQGKLRAHLERHKQYPRAAQMRRQQGVCTIRFVMDREGNVLSMNIVRSSGSHTLDKATEDLLVRAQPLPKPPHDMHHNTIELVVPIQYVLN